MEPLIPPADIQDRDGALSVLTEIRRLFPFIERIFTDGGYRKRLSDPAQTQDHRTALRMALAVLRLAMIRIMMRRIARSRKPANVSGEFQPKLLEDDHGTEFPVWNFTVSFIGNGS
ncbi:transposase, IS4 (plasmid) [Tistrella mobilis KA081020-065]|uniref:Transposase, IS4 n=1 Tax=Tistrella mobilis (strain KA081020-065) TaxID=1110502 RepID=I3TS67_TISMK|nr:transposase, IS4 [Tistrella mobilis KA081020-065]